MPKLRGPGNADRSPFTLTTLAEPGIVIPAGSVVADFELPWLLNYISGRKLVLAVAESNARKREAEMVIRKETERQSRLAAKARARKAELHVERLLHDLVRLQVRTPIAGMVVLEATYKAGSFGLYAQTRSGDRLHPGSLSMRIVDVSEMIVNASVNQVDAQTIGIGDKAVIELDAYPGERFEGRVVGLGAVASSSSGLGKYSRGGPSSFLKQIPIRVLIGSKDDRILPDLSASVDVIYSGSQSGVIVPREAIRSEPEADGGSFVHVAKDGAFHKRPVRVHGINDTGALVASGLKSGEEVLLTALPESLDNT